MSDKKSVRDELAELTEAVRELREDEIAAELRRLRAEVEQLRAERSGHHGCGRVHCSWGHCGCFATHYYSQPYVWTSGVTSIGINPVTSGTVPYPLTGTMCVSGAWATDPRVTSAVTTNLPGDITVTNAVVGISYDTVN